ncbi:MAG: GTPase RsgA, partial [Phycisphaerae bacterium]
MPSRRRKGRKVRVDFRQNRQQRRRTDDWTRRYHDDQDKLVDERLTESVRAKGDLSRKRTVIVDEDDIPVVDKALWRCGVVTAVHGLVCRVDDEQDRHWDCTVRGVLRTLLIEQRSSVTVGDRVWFSDHSKAHDGEPVGVIERVAERTTTLSRRDRRKREHAIVANADQLLIVTSIAQPALKPHLIDRYLVAAARGDLRPVICFNKCDLEPEAIEFEEEPEGASEPNAGRGGGPSIDETFEEFRAL